MHRVGARRYFALIVSALLPCLFLSTTVAHAESATPDQWWKNCANYSLTDRCIESIEYFDEKTQQWIKATAEKNPVYHEGPITDEDRQKYASGVNERSELCGYGHQLNFDTCYRIPGAATDGGEQILQSVVYGGTEELKLSFEATNGPVLYVRPRYGDSLYGVRENSLWRMTVISDLFGQDAGIARAQMKDPTLDVFKGSDGRWRVQASGRVQSIYGLEAWEPSMPTCDDALKSKNEFKSNDVRRPFSINVARYQYEYEKLKGSPPAGVFITNNGGCFSRLDFDQTNRIISVAVGGPHFDTDGKEIEGWVEASIRGDVIRKAFNAEPKTMNQAIIEVVYSDGQTQNATSSTKYIPATDKVEIRAYGFHYSQPTLKMKLQPVEEMPAPKPAPSMSSMPAPTTKSSTNTNGVKTISCIRGKTVKKVSGANPKCPTGYKLKK